MRRITLEKARTKLGLTQKVLAQRAGVDQTTISKLELGILNNPTLGMIEKLAGVLKVNPWALIFGGSRAGRSSRSSTTRSQRLTHSGRHVAERSRAHSRKQDKTIALKGQGS